MVERSAPPVKALRLLWKRKRYPQAAVCCCRLARLEPKGSQLRGHQHEPRNCT